MIPVFQTLFGGINAPSPERGNCFPACIASILEVPLQDVPHWYSEDGERWWDIVAWLQKRAWTLWALDWPLHEHTARSLEGNIVIVSGKSPRFPDSNHAVLGRLTKDGWELVHDPHPAGTGVTEPPCMIELVIPYVQA